MDSPKKFGDLSAAKRQLLAAMLRQQGIENAEQPTIPRREDPEWAPLSISQESLWFLHQMDPHCAVYNVPGATRIRGLLDVAALERALDEIVRRHETLRTTFVERGGVPIQKITRHEPQSLRLIAIDQLSPADRVAAAMRLATEESQRPFDLAREFSFRVFVVRFAPDDHVLVVNMHHIVSDGWSMAVFTRELLALYPAFTASRPSPLEELPIQFGDVSTWQRATMTDDALEPMLSYWRQQLSAAPAILPLPTDKPRAKVQGFRGQHQELAIDPSLSEAIRAWGRQRGATAFEVLLAAFHALLYGWTGEEDQVVGTPLANRGMSQLEGLIGYFANIMPLCAHVAPRHSFNQLVSQVREVMSGASRHQGLPFGKLVERLQPRRDPGCNPIFQVAFTLLNPEYNPPIYGYGFGAPLNYSLELAGLELSPLGFECGLSKFDLTVLVWDAPEQIAGTIEYDSDLFLPDTMAQLADQYVAVLRAVVANSEIHVQALAQIMTETALLWRAAKRTVAGHGGSSAQGVLGCAPPPAWNDTAREYLRDACLADLFEAHAARNPDAVAVTVGDRQTTYGELNARANQLAHYLRKRDVGPDVLVALFAERSLEMIVGMLGVLKAGGAYLPLDTKYPRARLALMLDDAAPGVVLTHSTWRSDLPEYSAEFICLDSDWHLIRGESSTNLSHQADGSNLAYVMYTSGSTGVPKGVAVTQRGVSRLVLNTNYIQLGPTEVIAHASTCSFDASTFEIWGALLCGGRLVILDQDLVLSPRRLAAELRRQRVSTMWVTCALFNQIAREEPTAFASLDQVLFGGEAADPRWVREVLAQGPPRRLINGYGPTETTVFATAYEVRELAADATTVPIGTPIANTSIYLLDENRQRVTVGMAGEIYIGGDGVARGYLLRPELTAARFIPDPFCQAPGGRLYKSGDLGRYLPDGNIEFLGRIDQQVKIRGFRIELGEIEAGLNQHPNVRESVVLAREDQPGEKRLVAYIVPQRLPKPTAAELRTHLQESLPAYMVPVAYVSLAALPITINGKLDRAALPIPQEESFREQRTIVAPRNATEAALVALWEELLNVRPIGVHDNFFELGGHSLLAIRLVSLLEQRLGHRVAMAGIFRAPTIEQLAESLLALDEAGKIETIIAFRTDGTRPPLFFFPLIDGYAFYMNTLVGHLDQEQPVYCLQPAALDGQTAPQESIEAMAAAYLEEIRRIQPNGPYFLCGYCFSGITAYEVACQLRRQGEPVALLALVDSIVPQATKPQPVRRRLLGHVRKMRRLSIGDRLAYVGERLQALWRRVASPFNGAVSSRESDIADSSIAEILYRIERASREALDAYIPQPFPGRITLIQADRTESGDFIEVEPLDGWGPLALQGIEVIQLDCGHRDFFDEKHAQILAKRLCACIQAAQERPAPDTGDMIDSPPSQPASTALFAPQLH